MTKPADQVAPAVVFAVPAQVVVAANGSFTTQFSCPASEASCTTALSITITITGPARAVGKPIVSVKVVVAGGASKRVTIKLPAKVRAAIAKAAKVKKSIPATLRQTVTDASGNTRTATKAIRLKSR